MNRYNVRLLIIAFFICIWILRLYAQEKPIDNNLQKWSDGHLDIHFINTGKGESVLYILPDGTSMLVDAGVTNTSEVRGIPIKPNESRTPGEWISRYIHHFLPEGKNDTLDYILVSHYHEDHIGGITSKTNESSIGDYKLTGITEVGELVHFGKIIDSGWPLYDYPLPLTSVPGTNYMRFVNWMNENKQIDVEKFKVGSNNQLNLVQNPDKYPDFEIRNIAANGFIWTGTADNVKNHFPPIESIPKDALPNQNMCSIAFRLSYGKFDFFTGGDIYFETDHIWQDVETPIGLVTGPVDVCKANHHANYDSMGEKFLQALRPKVVIIHNWIAQQPDMATLRRILSEKIYPGPREVFSTNLRNESIIVGGWAMERLTSNQGHVVVRVQPGGDNYFIYILDDSNELYKIKNVYGPYPSN